MENITTTEKRGNKMAFDKIKYNDDWKREKRDRLVLRIPKGNNEKLEAMAQKFGKTRARFIKDALYYYMDSLGEERINLE